ncbi:MAG: restriction endonuclease, partial [Acidobacteriota bacterium]|nr:restriction endonuclease [Acidobacteriota bacterium]
MGLDLIPEKIRELYEVHEWRHAAAVLFHEFPDEFNDIMAVLGTFRLRKECISVGGGRKSRASLAIDGPLYSR